MSSAAIVSRRLDRPVDPSRDHVLGPPDAEITLVEYGSYDCPHCRAANERIAEVREQFGDRLLYVFRHRPVTGSDIAYRAAELAERIEDAERFWAAHVALMSRSARLTEDDLRAVGEEYGVGGEPATVPRALERIGEDMQSAAASGVMFTPTFFINGRRYDGPWDESALSDAMLGSLGHRVRSAALEFASWAPSAGLLLLLGAIVAIVITNSASGAAFTAFWDQQAGITFGDGGLHMPLKEWINNGLLTLFFLVVGLEIKREFTVGHLATRRSAALPVAASIGGMAFPALLYM
ncbi:MAG: Na+/H+ antiporter NhaA, partial [Woeseiaceae bacterium]